MGFSQRLKVLCLNIIKDKTKKSVLLCDTLWRMWKNNLFFFKNGNFTKDVTVFIYIIIVRTLYLIL